MTSFVTIGGVWLAHHAIFRRLASADSVVMQLNLQLLLLVSFLPFPIKPTPVRTWFKAIVSILILGASWTRTTTTNPCN